MKIIEFFKNYMNIHQIRYFQEDNTLEWYLSSSSRMGMLHCVLQSYSGKYAIQIYLPVKANYTIHDEMLKVAEFITRVNSNLYVGIFLLDWNTGELSFRYPLTEEIHTPDTIVEIMKYILSIVDSYGDAFLSVLFSNIDIKEYVYIAKHNSVIPSVGNTVEEAEEEEDTPPDWGNPNIVSDEEAYEDIEDDDEEEFYPDTEEDDDNITI